MGMYDDIIDTEYRGVTNHSRMSLMNRAAQFAPFAALNGHEAAIAETARVTSRFIDLTEDEQLELSRKLSDAVMNHSEVTITYFVKDVCKAGGMYTSVTGRIRQIDGYERVVELVCGKKIPLRYIYSLRTIC